MWWVLLLESLWTIDIIPSYHISESPNGLTVSFHNTRSKVTRKPCLYSSKVKIYFNIMHHYIQMNHGPTQSSVQWVTGACNSILEHILCKLEIGKCKMKQNPKKVVLAYSLLWYSIIKESVRVVQTYVTIFNILYFYGEKLADHQTFELEDCLLLDVHNGFFNVFTATEHV